MSSNGQNEAERERADLEVKVGRLQQKVAKGEVTIEKLERVSNIFCSHFPP